MDAELELRHVRGEGAGDPVPPGFELDVLTFPAGPEALDRAREVMTAVLTGRSLPGWFVAQCVDDAEIQTCNVDRWSLRAWKFWLAPENRRWWWWAVEPADGQITVRALVRGKPYLRGSLDWLWKAAN
ncbi:MAG: hypothetical protein M3Z98_07695 [Candidatus Dormibacteraeota bacterium]|nr:hypothetical protein [Candidatus Dormibacteraeota bacterium]